MQTKTLTFILLIVGVFALPASIALGASITPNPVDQNATFDISVTNSGDTLIIYDFGGNALEAYGSTATVDPQSFSNSITVLPLGDYILAEVDGATLTVGTNASLSVLLQDAGFISMTPFTVEIPEVIATSTSALSVETDSMMFYFMAILLFIACFTFFYHVFRIFTS